MDHEAIKAQVQQRFSAAAQGYVTSVGHAHGDDLAQLVQLAQLRGHEHVLDIATGGGHTALAFAPHVQTVVASDLTPQMLAAAEAFIRGRGVTNVRFEIADAEALPYADASFDIVTVRIAPHHFPAPQRFVREAARVLRPGGRLLLDDNMAPADPALDAFMNRFEQWRDPSHVRAYSVDEWRGWIADAGLTVVHVEPLTHKRYAFAEWAARMHMPAEQQAALESWLLAAPAHCREFFQITDADGHVQSLCGTFAIIVAQK